MDDQSLNFTHQQQRNLIGGSSIPRSSASTTDEREHLFITRILASDLVSGLRRIPAGFHVAIEVNGKTSKTSNQPALFGNGAVEWSDSILLPSNRSSVVSFKVFASFERGPRLGNGEILRQFKISVGDILDPKGQRQQLSFSNKRDDLLKGCSSFKIVTERLACNFRDEILRPHMPELHIMNETVERLTDAGHYSLLLYRQHQHQADLDEAISCFQRVRDICPLDHSHLSAVLFNLANAEFINCQANNHYVNLKVPIALYRDVLKLRSPPHSDYCATVLHLSFALLARFHTQQNQSARIEAVDLLTQVADSECCPVESYEYQAACIALQIADIPPSIEDIWPAPSEKHHMDSNDEMLIGQLQSRMQRFSTWNPRKPIVLAGIAEILYHRFKRNGDLGDIHNAISAMEDSLQLVEYEHPERPGLLNNLGCFLLTRFEQLGDVADINRSIVMKEEALHLTPDGKDEKLELLTNLGNSLMYQFDRFKDSVDIHKSIALKEEAVSLTPDGHSNKPGLLSNLGSSLSRRFRLLGDIADLNRAILMMEETLNLTSDGDLSKSRRLSNLGTMCFHRFKHLGNIVDLDRSISKMEEAVQIIPDGHPDKPRHLSNLGIFLFRRFQMLGEPTDIHESVLKAGKAVHLSHDNDSSKPAMLSNLGNSLSCRFQHFGNIADIDQSILMNEKALHITPDNHPGKLERLNNLGTSLYQRFDKFGKLADIELAILMFQKAISFASNNHYNKPIILNNLGSSLLGHFLRTRNPANLEKCISIRNEAIHITPDGHPDKPKWFFNLGNSLHARFLYTEDIGDIDMAISMFGKAIHLIPNGHTNKPTMLHGLGLSLVNRFEQFGDIADIKKSILVHKEAVNLTPDGHANKSKWLKNLGDAFMAYYKHSNDHSYLLSAISHYSLASCSSVGHTSIRFHAVQQWISSAYLMGDLQGVCDAYTIAIGLLPQLAWLGLTISDRYHVLLKAVDIAQNAAVVALDTGHPKMAIEWLEHGHSIVWGQLLQLRTPVDELCIEHPELAHQFQQISQELEQLSSGDSITSALSVNSLSNSDSVTIWSLEQEVQRHHELALQREKLLAEIQSLPGFTHFLLPKPFEQIASLATNGPVVYLNASKRKCNALIVMKQPMSVIPVSLPGVKYGYLRFLIDPQRHPMSRDDTSELILPEPDDLKLSQEFLNALTENDTREGTTMEGFGSDARLRWILAFLWKKVVYPVLEALGLLIPPFCAKKLTHISWCPMGPFSFLPIHAAGIYGTNQQGDNLPDLVISSYIPTLSALESSTRGTNSDLSSNICLVVVPQPKNDGQIELPGVKHEMDYINALSAKSNFVTVYESCGTVEDVKEKMMNADWVHFACHGLQDPNKPLDSGLFLDDHCRLKLSDIIQLPRPQGGLAFLSACQTARGDQKLPGESIHLAAGMLLAGYRNVIATMWSINDRDAPKVTKEVYKFLFRDGKVPDSTEAAEALHYAVNVMRKSGAPFSSWVPFIHLGQ